MPRKVGVTGRGQSVKSSRWYGIQGTKATSLYPSFPYRRPASGENPGSRVLPIGVTRLVVAAIIRSRSRPSVGASGSEPVKVSSEIAPLELRDSDRRVGPGAGRNRRCDVPVEPTRLAFRTLEPCPSGSASRSSRSRMAGESPRFRRFRAFSYAARPKEETIARSEVLALRGTAEKYKFM